MEIIVESHLTTATIRITHLIVTVLSYSSSIFY